MRSGAAGAMARTDVYKIFLLGREFPNCQSLEAYLEGLIWQVAELLDARFGAFVLQDRLTNTLQTRAALAIACQLTLETWATCLPVLQAMDRGESILFQTAGPQVASTPTPIPARAWPHDDGTGRTHVQVKLAKFVLFEVEYENRHCARFDDGKLPQEWAASPAPATNIDSG